MTSTEQEGRAARDERLVVRHSNFGRQSAEVGQERPNLYYARC